MGPAHGGTAHFSFPVVTHRAVRGKGVKDEEIRLEEKLAKTQHKPLPHRAPAACGTEPTNAVRGAQVVEVNVLITSV